MFESIYKKSYNEEACTATFNLTDSEFKLCAKLPIEYQWYCDCSVLPIIIILEYGKRHKDIIHNLYLLNIFLVKENTYYTFEQFLEHQNLYTDTVCSKLELNFSKEIYPKLLEMHKTYKLYV